MPLIRFYCAGRRLYLLNQRCRPKSTGLLRVSTPCLQRMSTVSWLFPPFHLVVVPLQVALRHSLLPYEVNPGPSLPTMSARVSIDTCAWSTSAILRPRMASTRRPGLPRRRGRPPRRQARLCWKIGSASPTHVPAAIACFRDILQQIVLPTRGRPPPYESSSSGLLQRTNIFFRSMTLALQYVPGTGRAAWTSAGTTRMFCPL
jgi:hypothetical protein